MTPELATLVGVAWLVLRVELMFRRIRRAEALGSVLAKGHDGNPLSHKLVAQALKEHDARVF